MFKGNKGEWSEIYTLIKLLGDEKLHAADENLEKIEDVFFFVQEIFKSEFTPPIKYRKDGIIKIIDYETDEVLEEMPKEKFFNNAIKLYDGIKEGKGRTFEIPTIESFLKQAKVSSLKASGQTTADIHIKLYDPRTKLQPKLGYSIKSFIGGKSTLFNPNNTTNFIYKVNFNSIIDVDEFNRETYQGRNKLIKRLKLLEDIEAKLKFDSIESDNLYRNLFLVDSDLPEIVAHLLLLRYRQNESNLYEITKIIEDINPLAYPKDSERSYYTYKIKKMLRDMAMGMTSETPWDGDFDASGGTLVVKNDGDIVCYHVYDIKMFEEYLLRNTFFETPSTGEDSNNPGNPKSTGKDYNFGWLYEENGEIFLKLNLQIRYSG